MNKQQAINLLKNLEQSLDDYCELNDEGKTAFRMAITALEVFGNAEQLPSAQPERKKGHWEHVEIYSANSERLYYSLPDCSCSECGIMIQAETNYCPNCGSYMRGEKHETD